MTEQQDSLKGLKYQVSLNATPEPTYEDGFADGYSRAWKECWEHMRQIAQSEWGGTEPTTKKS